MSASAGKKTILAKLADGVEGTTTFTSRVNTSYRFRLDAKQGKLQFWLEDRKTKQQWQTSVLEMKDVVSKGGAIPNTTFDDYAVCFLMCLESPLPSDDFERDLVLSEAKQNAWELRLTLKLRTFVSTWTPTYRFLLEPVPLERVDLLAAKVRDQEELIERLANGREAVHLGPPPYFRATSTTDAGHGHTLVWTRVDGNSEVIEVQENGAIQIKKGGVFVVNASIQNYSSSTIRLLVNGEIATSVVDGSNHSRKRSTELSHVLMTQPDDRISILYSGNGCAYSDSSIIIYQLR